MKKTKPAQQTVYYIPTLLDKSGVRHIIPGKDSAAYCGATGSQHFLGEHRAADLCSACVEAHIKAVVLEKRLTRFGL